jgi:hypothetical protein
MKVREVDRNTGELVEVEYRGYHVKISSEGRVRARTGACEFHGQLTEEEQDQIDAIVSRIAGEDALISDATIISESRQRDMDS